MLELRKEPFANTAPRHVIEDEQENIRVLVYTSLDLIKQSLWDSIIGKTSLLNSYAYLKAVEKSRINHFRYAYFLFYHGKKLIAHASTGILSFGLDLMVKKGLKKIFDFIKRFYPAFLVVKMIECGPTTAIGPSLTIKQEKYHKKVLRLLDKALQSLAVKENSKFILIRDINSHQKRTFDYLRCLGYRSVQNLPTTLMRVNYQSFEEYVKSLNSKRRHEVLHRINAFYQLGCKIEKIVDFAPLAGEITRLWRQTYQQSKEYQREILNKAYFSFMSDYLGEKSFIFLCKQKDKFLGFTMLLDAGDTLISTYCGLDYTLNKKTHTYFVMYYKTIEEAIVNKKKWIDLGITNYNPKIEIGALPEPVYVYAKSTNRLLAGILTPLLSLMNGLPTFHKRRIFNERYFERHKLSKDVVCYINDLLYKICDVSMEGLSVTGSTPLKNRIVPIWLDVPNIGTLYMLAECRHQTELSDGNWRLGFKIKKLKNEYLMQWNYLVDSYIIPRVEHRKL